MQDCKSANVNDLDTYYDETKNPETGSCDPGYFENSFGSLRREANSACMVDAEGKLRRLLNKEVRCHNRNRVDPLIAGQKPAGTPYTRYDNIIDFRGLDPNMNLYQKQFSEDIENRVTETYTQEINDNCSIVALHNMGILCRDFPNTLRRFNPDSNLPLGSTVGVNLNRQQMYRIVTEEHKKKYPSDTVVLASYETPEQALAYLTGADKPAPNTNVPRLEGDHVTLMMFEYFNINFDPAQNIGHPIQNPGQPTIYNYPYHIHCAIVLNDIYLNKIYVFEPFKSRKFLWLEYFEYFKNQLNPNLIRTEREGSISGNRRVNDLYTAEYTRLRNAGQTHNTARNDAKRHVINYSNDLANIPNRPQDIINNITTHWNAQPPLPLPPHFYGGNTTLASRGINLQDDIIRRIYFFHIEEVQILGSPYNRRVHSPLRKVSLKSKASPKRKVSLKRKASPKRSPKKRVLKNPKSPKKRVSPSKSGRVMN